MSKYTKYAHNSASREVAPCFVGTRYGQLNSFNCKIGRYRIEAVYVRYQTTGINHTFYGGEVVVMSLCIIATQLRCVGLLNSTMGRNNLHLDMITAITAYVCCTVASDLNQTLSSALWFLLRLHCRGSNYNSRLPVSSSGRA